MTKADLTIALLRYRWERAGMLQGFSKGEAALMAEQRLKNEGVLGFFGKMKLPGTPEGAIVAIVDAFWRSQVQQMSANEAFGRIEAHRKRFYGGSGDYPTDLTEYVIYRLETEMPQIHHIEPEQMGLDRECISRMVEECNSYFRARTSELR